MATISFAGTLSSQVRKVVFSQAACSAGDLLGQMSPAIRRRSHSGIGGSLP